MGTEVRLVVHQASAFAECHSRVGEWFASVESAASRFAADSELNRLADGRLETPSGLLRELRGMSEQVARLTGGLVTPYERRSLESAGYDVTFSKIRERHTGQPRAPFSKWGRLDFGGVAKGWTVDEALRRIAPLCTGALLDAGGDIGVVGDAPAERPWWVAIDGSSRNLVVAVRGGGIATSSTRRRAWRGPDGPAHHIIDPRTGCPARSDVIEATVWGRSALCAEVAAKALVIAGRAGAPVIRDWFPEAVLFTLSPDGSEQADDAFREEVLACVS